MEASFYDLPFAVAPGRVMAPRHATEALVDAALERIGSRRVRIVDVGTGSGAVAIAIAVHAPLAEVWATDVSVSAVALARRNASRHGVRDRVHVVETSMLGPVPRPLDLLVANLPYLPEPALAGARRYDADPWDAIYAPGDGLAHYRRLLDAARESLRPDGALLLQLHRRVLGAERHELDELRARLCERPLAA
jgi:release factor glutamine methyltransferase